MKIKTTLLAISAICISAVAAPVAAHSISSKSLRPSFGAAATDVWQTTCSGGSDHLFAQIRDHTADKNIVSLVVVSGTKAATTSDLVGGNTQSSPAIKVFGGNATYTLLVNHTLGTGQVYSIEYHCEDAAGNHTTTTVPSAASQDN